MTKKRKSTAPAQAKILAGQIGAEAADKFRTVKQYYRGNPIKFGSTARRAANFKDMLRGGVTGYLQAEAIEGKAKKAKRLLKTGARVGKKLLKKKKKDTLMDDLFGNKRFRYSVQK